MSRPSAKSVGACIKHVSAPGLLPNKAAPVSARYLPCASADIAKLTLRRPEPLAADSLDEFSKELDPLGDPVELFGGDLEVF